MKMTSSLEPLFITLNSGEIGELLNQSPADITWDNVVYGNKITYFYLASMFKGSLKSGGIGKLALQDLLQFIGREYAFGGKTELNLNIFVDEFYNVIFDGYVDLLNKAGGTNTRVFLAMQTTDDVVSALGEQAKARQILANTNTKIFLRVPELEVAKVFTELTPKDYVMTRMKTLASGANSNLDGSLFGTNVGDRLIPEETNLVTEEFLSSLPVGQAFLRYQGKIYKVRIPYLNIEHEESFSKKILSFEEDIEDEHLKNLSFEG
jgi:conjugal transfer pilus assembly protein TraD